ncbi:hypothetical protein K474DRAFT_1771646 [Panus rudis PR-1116 ss-1]|nr:hypothetical protein K474DRAFT_1771646 [Panus rudis PR-1116 ss-1]
MSARQPFVPQRVSRPVAQAEQNPADNNSTDDDQFRPNGLLGEPESKATEKPTSRTRTQSGNEGAVKPLNISTLITKQNEHPNGRPSRKSSIDNNGGKATGNRAAMKGPFANAQAMRAAQIAEGRATSPFVAGTPPFLGAGADVRAAKLQSTNSADDLSSNQAHIPNNRVAPGGLSTGGDGHTFVPNKGPGFRPMYARSSLESIEEGEEDGREAHGRERTGDPSLNNFELYHGEQHQEENPQNHAEGPVDKHYQQLSVGRKRVYHIEEEEVEYGPAGKRYKSDLGLEDKAMLQYPEYNRHSTPMPPIPQHCPQPMRPIMPMVEENALHRLLGQDLDACTEKHYAKYMAAKKRWADCDESEWKAGGDELANKFSKLIDFVKDHMTTKLTLYTSLHSAVAAHRKTLTEREQSLKEAREGLVRDGANVVGSVGGTVAHGDE